MDIDKTIFRAYDIRGVYGKTISEDVFEAVGNVFRKFSGKKLIVGMDSRVSSPSLKDAFIRGIRKAGVDVTDIGMVPRGAAMFWSWKQKIICAYISASHLPAEWNGIKFIEPNGGSFSQKEYDQMYKMIEQDDFLDKNRGRAEKKDVLDDYKQFLMEKLPEAEKQLKVLLDCGNGTAGLVVEEVFRKKGYKPTLLFERPDGTFPNRESELTTEALEEARKKASNFDMTIAFDGDADRLAVIDDRGRIIPPETVAYIIMKELLKETEGPVVANVECSRILDSIAEKFGREVHRTPVGYTFVIKGLLENKGCFGVESSMHFCIPSVMPFDDAVVAGLYAAYSASRMESLSEFMDSVSAFLHKKLNFECPSENDKIRIMERIKKRILKDYPDTNTLDGVRVDTEKGWVLIRQSNTSPLIRMSIEADDRETMKELEKTFGGIVKEEISSS